jgi:hypothetical protein
MYFAKFFHKPPGDDDRLLGLTVEAGMLRGDYLKEVDDSESEEFLSRDFQKIGEGVRAFRQEAEKLREAGYTETHHTDSDEYHSKRDFTPKPEWQCAIDEAAMAAFADPLDVQAARLAALAGTPAADEPMILWLAALHASASEQPDALEKAKRARDALRQRESDAAPHYTWTLSSRDLKGAIYDLLTDCYLAADPPDPSAAVEAITIAHETDPDEDRWILRALIICEYLPEREEDAFDSIQPWAHLDRYEEITSLPSYAAYAAKRAEDAAAGRGTWRWSGGRPTDDAAIEAAEGALGVTLPEDYRGFLRERGPCELFARLPTATLTLGFLAADQLRLKREEFIEFVTLTESEASAAGYYHERYGLSLHHLVPIAEPSGTFNLLLLHTEPGDKYGHCYVWNHEDVFDPYDEQPSFKTMMEMLLAGIERVDETALHLFD